MALPPQVIERQAADRIDASAGRAPAPRAPEPAGDPRIRILDEDELLDVFEDEARAAVERSDRDDPRRCAGGAQLTWRGAACFS